MVADRLDGRGPSQLRPLGCSRNIINRAHGSSSWFQGDTRVIAAVYGPKAGTKKHENPETACIEVIWKPKTGVVGKAEREYEMILKKTLQSITLSFINPNTTTSVIIQVVNDDGSLLPCAINAACFALVDAGIQLKHLAVAICCGVLSSSGRFILDPTKVEEQKIMAYTYLVFPNSKHSVLSKGSSLESGAMEDGILTSVSYGLMTVQVRVFDEKQSRMIGETVKMLLCFKDWLDVESRNQDRGGDGSSSENNSKNSSCSSI